MDERIAQALRDEDQIPRWNIQAIDVICRIGFIKQYPPSECRDLWVSVLDPLSPGGIKDTKLKRYLTRQGMVRYIDFNIGGGDETEYRMLILEMIMEFWSSDIKSEDLSFRGFSVMQKVRYSDPRMLKLAERIITRFPEHLLLMGNEDEMRTASPIRICFEYLAGTFGCNSNNPEYIIKVDEVLSLMIRKTDEEIGRQGDKPLSDTAKHGLKSFLTSIIGYHNRVSIMPLSIDAFVNSKNIMDFEKMGFTFMSHFICDIVENKQSLGLRIIESQIPGLSYPAISQFIIRSIFGRTQMIILTSEQIKMTINLLNNCISYTRLDRILHEYSNETNGHMIKLKCENLMSIHGSYINSRVYPQQLYCLFESISWGLMRMKGKDSSPWGKAFYIIIQLPNEMKMLICNLICGNPNFLIPSKDLITETRRMLRYIHYCDHDANKI